MQFYNIKDDYIAYLKQYDKKVADNKNAQRPYVGVVLEINSIKYYTPFSSPKPKHRTMKNAKDFRKINQGIYGAINFNNMLPVTDDALLLIDIDHLKDKKYQRLLQNQYRYIKADEAQILNTAHNLHTLIFTEGEKLTSNDKRIKSRCCNLPLLESLIKQRDKT